MTADIMPEQEYEMPRDRRFGVIESDNYTEEFDPEWSARAIDAMIKDAEAVLVPGTRYELRAKKGGPYKADFGHSIVTGNWAIWRDPSNGDAGYLLVARLTAGRPRPGWLDKHRKEINPCEK